MRTTLQGAALTLLFLTSVSHAATQGPFTSSLIEEDLFALTEELRTYHAGLYRYNTPEEFDDFLGESLYELAEEPTALEAYRLIGRVVAKVHCGHTRLQLTGRLGKEITDKVSLLPIEIHIVGDRAWVLSTIGDVPGVEPGQELLEINGQSFREICAEAFSQLFSDGFNETHKARLLESQFSRRYATLVDPEGMSRDHHCLRLAGAEEDRVVQGLSTAEYAARPERGTPRPYMKLTKLSESTAHLYVREFGDEVGERPDFPTQLEANFKRLKQSGAKQLILDLRGNGGGDDMYGALLVSYLSPKPFRYFDSILVTPGYDGWGNTEERDGQRYVTSHPGTQLQQPAAHRFPGRVTFLTDGWTFSTAADVATVSHYNGLATFVGEEPGGGYDGNTSGSTKSFTLPNTGLTVSVPRMMYITANLGHEHAGRGVPMDSPIRPTVEEVLQGTDAVLNKALRLIERNSE